jgi:ubiquinone/menaquinone biosynthesis C-methylase UbiE
MKKILLSYIFFSFFGILHASFELKEHEKWWQSQCCRQDKFKQFCDGVGDEKAPSRIYVRNHILEKKYKSVLDIPCGLCVDFVNLKQSNPEITYLGIDITQLFVDRAINCSVPATLGKIQEIPVPDSSFDVTYSRNILEHLNTYQSAIQELVRVAKQEVIIVFFIKPTMVEHDAIIVCLVDGYPLFYNQYSKSKLEAFLKTLPKVKTFSWSDINEMESALHIIL